MYNQPNDTQILGAAEFYTQYIPKQFEYRVHVVGNEVVKVSQKVATNQEDYDPVVWNHTTGFTFRNVLPTAMVLGLGLGAVRSLNLHFGAVDIITGVDGKEYVLEVNTAPGIIDSTLEDYGVALSRMIGRMSYPSVPEESGE
jgi:glutathione synthase/RimK-type ligase-like ATP-grasp enzyme